jgi:hypothetical protein
MEAGLSLCGYDSGGRRGRWWHAGGIFGGDLPVWGKHVTKKSFAGVGGLLGGIGAVGGSHVCAIVGLLGFQDADTGCSRIRLC